MSYIHKEGKNIISISLMIYFIIILICYFIFNHYLIKVTCSISIILFLIIQFFRNPKRKKIKNDKFIIAPADGKIVVIEEVYENEFFKDKKIQISIFMSPFNVHLNRYPISGKIKYLKYHPGKYFFAWNPKSSIENERFSTVIENKFKFTILIRQIAGAFAKRIINYSKIDNLISQGEEMGFIKFGSRVDIILPKNIKINVNLNDRTSAGETVIAEIL